MKKQNISIIVISIILILIGLGAFLLGTLLEQKSPDNTKLSENDVEEYIKKIGNTLIYGGSREDVIEVLQINDDDLMDTDMMSGPDMYLRQIPEKSVIENADISSYKKVGNKCAKNLEKYIQDNYEYNIEGIADGGDYWNALVNYRSYYYQAYLNDLSQIQIELLSLAGYQLDGPNVNANKELKLAIYKSRIKAASVLDSHLDDYVNSDESNQTYVEFKNKEIKSSSKGFMSYMMNLSGYSYDFQGNILTSDQARQYLTLAGVDFENPLAL